MGGEQLARLKLYNRAMGVLKEVSHLRMGDTFAFDPGAVEPEDGPLLPRLVCTGIMPISAQAVRGRSRPGVPRGDQYSVYYHLATGGDTQAKRVSWDAKVIIYAGEG